MDNNELVKLIIELAVVIVAFFVGKYIFPKYKTTIQQHATEFEVLLNYAESFCAYARQFLDSSGEEKMNTVVEKLRNICEQQGIKVDDETLRAIAQKAYDAMVAGENSSKVIIESAVNELKSTATAGLAIQVIDGNIEEMEPVLTTGTTSDDAEKIIEITAD